MTSPLEIRVRAGGGTRDYPVLLGPGLRHEIAALAARVAPSVRYWAVVSDETVAPLHAEGVATGLAEAGRRGDLVTFPAGEAEKTRDRWAAVTDTLLARGLGRDAGIVAVGGGVVGDLAGFVAATYMRGIPVLQIPTSLLAMIDASVGGKTAVDTPAGKNLVGAFHPPAAVVVDPEVIGTLPEVERRWGLAEAVKHGAILDEGYGEDTAAAARALLDGEPGAILQLVRRSVELKARVVSEDERETGLREILNFGHTVGHALEHASDFRIAHGAGVAMGMVWEASLGERMGVTEAGTAATIAGWLSALGLPTQPEPVDPVAFAAGLGVDKKARDGTPRVVLLARCGQVAPAPDGGWAHRVPSELVEALAPWPLG